MGNFNIGNTAYEVSDVTELSSSVDVDLVDYETVRKCFFEGNLYSYKPVIWANHDIHVYNINQDFSRKYFLLKTENEEKEKSGFKWAVKFKHRLQNKVIDFIDEAEKKVANVESGARFQDFFFWCIKL